jgi:hypothetical protein
MERATYKAGRRMMIASGVAGVFEALYGLRLVAEQQADFEAMMLESENAIDVTLEEDE